MSWLSLVVFFSISKLFSYDKIEVVSYAQNAIFEQAKTIYPDEDRVYVVSGSKIFVYSSTLSYISSYNILSQSPVSFAVGENIYVVDDKNCSVDVYSKKMDFLYRFSECGREASQLLKPSDIKIYSGKVFVSDLNGYINVYTLDGIFLYSFSTLSKDGSYRYSPSKISFGPDGYLYLIDRKKKVIVKYDFYGKYQSEFPYTDEKLSFDISEDGFLYSGSMDGKVREYDLSFTQTGIFGTKGRNKYEFEIFSDIKAYSDKVFILDCKNKKILSLRIYNKNRKKYKPSLFDDKIIIRAGKVFPISGSIFNISDNEILFYSNKKGEEGIYTLVDSVSKKIIPCTKTQGSACLVNDMVYDEKHIYVIDGSEFKIKVFDKEGSYISSFGDKAGFMSSNIEGKFAAPIKLAIDKTEKIYVLDKKLQMVQVFNSDGIFLYSIDLASYNERFIDIFSDEDNKIYMLSAKKIYVFSSNGKFEKVYDLNEVNSAISFCYDNVNYIFVLDNVGSVKVYDRQLKYVTSFIGKGKGLREIYLPYQIRYNKGYLYISDSLNRIVSFKIEYPVKGLLYAVYDSTSCVNFNYSFDNKEYLKEFYIEKSTDGLNFFKTQLKDNDCNILSGNTYYYRLYSISLSDNKHYTDVSIYIPSKAEKKSEEAKQINRPPLEIIPLNLDYIFSANYKYYTSNPVGRIMIKNNTSSDFENVKLSFFIKEYMDFPYDTIINKLSSGSQVEASINATLNSKIVTVTENTPVQANLSLEYYIGSEKKEQTLSIPVRILSKNSMVWDEPKRIASFITVKDPIISSIAKILSAKKDEIKAEVDENIKAFSLIYNYISLLNIKYVEDPVTPFKLSRSTTSVIDTVQYPRNLIKIKAGDCDDLSVLFASLLEASGIPTAIIDYGDHLTLMFELKKDDVKESGISPDLIIDYNSKKYIPFEVTMLSKSIYDSIYYASSQYKSKKDVVKIYPVREILSIYEPPTFTEDESSIIEINSEVVKRADADCQNLEKKYFDYYVSYYTKILDEDPKNIDALINLGIILSLKGDYDKAVEIFESIISIDENNAAALNNAANIYHIKGNYLKAQSYYDKAYALDPFDENILVNSAKNYIKMGKKNEAKMIFDKAVKINPELKKKEIKIFQEEK